jgi:hypothetical protein
MRILKIAALCATLGGCWTPGQDVATPPRFGDQFVGKNVDAVVARLGKPSGRKRMDNDQMTYVWEFAAADQPTNQRSYTGQGGLYGDGQLPGAMSEDLRICKVSVITSPEGIVTQFDAEDSNGTGSSKIGLGISGSFCSQRLRL